MICSRSRPVLPDLPCQLFERHLLPVRLYPQMQQQGQTLPMAEHYRHDSVVDHAMSFGASCQVHLQGTKLTCRTSLRTSLPYLNVFLPGAALGEVGSAPSAVTHMIDNQYGTRSTRVRHPLHDSNDMLGSMPERL